MNIEIGNVVNIAGIDWIVLDKDENSVLCLTKDFVYENTEFDDNSNNYANSSIRNKLNGEFLDRITTQIGDDSILDTEIDLTSDDGLDDYGKVTDKIGLLTADMYRKYNRLVEKYPVDNWWWLSTAWSTPHRGYLYAVRCVIRSGTLDYLNCFNNSGVRPFCRFVSSIF